MQTQISKKLVRTRIRNDVTKWSVHIVRWNSERAPHRQTDTCFKKKKKWAYINNKNKIANTYGVTATPTTKEIILIIMNLISRIYHLWKEQKAKWCVQNGNVSFLQRGGGAARQNSAFCLILIGHCNTYFVYFWIFAGYLYCLLLLVPLLFFSQSTNHLINDILHIAILVGYLKT